MCDAHGGSEKIEDTVEKEIAAATTTRQERSPPPAVILVAQLKIDHYHSDLSTSDC